MQRKYATSSTVRYGTAVPASQTGHSASPLPAQEAGECGQGGVGHMVLDALRILLRRFRRNADGEQQVHHDAVPRAHTLCQLSPASVRNTPRYGLAIASPSRFNRPIVLIAVACETPRRRAMSVGRASPPLASRSEISST